MIDSHAHLDLALFNSDREQVIQKSQRKLSHLVTIGTTVESSQLALQLAQTTTLISAAIGIHPEDTPREMSEIVPLVLILKELAQSHPGEVAAIGEIGLDYYHRSDNKEIQKRLFIAQLELAEELGLPFIIHSRDAFNDTYTILNGIMSTQSRGILHSFTGSLNQAEQILNLGLLLGINGIVTYPSAQTLQQAIKTIPLEKIVLETDAPFLVPQTYRKQGIKRCEPWMVESTAEKIGILKNISIEKVSSATEQTTRSLFRLKG